MFEKDKTGGLWAILCCRAGRLRDEENPACSRSKDKVDGHPDPAVSDGMRQEAVTLLQIQHSSLDERLT